ncbi:DegT/DnrJ/EryC1/StrS family aminotransferase [Helicobacter pametensis]|uniref:DegT/DnrJ/EryC1/StrS family aminotransferase n=1 Tax=Helicobacter pametensis TaxID=95149 RepID=UPI000483D88F|nr:DegT/DnrJ/EryC1/StrS family aminotransferase [Helicobacter pametensis]
MTIDFANLSRQYNLYKHQIDSEISYTLKQASFIMGEQVERLEIALAQYAQSPHVIACSSGTDALILALMAADIGVDDEVITTPFSFFASSEAIAFLGARPVFVDIDEHTFNLDPALIEDHITSKTKAILPVSLFGQVCDMETISHIAQKYDLLVIEDASQSFGASYKGKKSCALSDFATTSFFPSKPLGCYGDGGAVFCQRKDDADKIRALLKHGQIRRYVHKYIGLNARLDTLQAGILLAKLPFLDAEILKRQEIALRYCDALKDCILPSIGEKCKSVFAQFSIRTKHREILSATLKKRGIPTAIHYPIPLHLQEAFAYLGYKRGDFPVSEKVADEILSLPMNAFLTEVEQEYIITHFNQIVASL